MFAIRQPNFVARDTVEELYQRRTDSNGRAIAFVDDFTAWVTGPTAQSTRKGIDAIINDILN